jgi:AraC-like DNA-binding protein
MKSTFGYFPVSASHQRWGIYASGYGQARIASGSSYPASAHPEDHDFTWEKGRVLSQYQILFIKEGRGTFESQETGKKNLLAGTVVFLFPGVWHRYRPAPLTGWTELWLELQGSQMKQLHQQKILHPTQALYRPGLHPEILGLFKEAEHLALTKPSGFTVRLGLLGLQLVTRVLWKPPTSLRVPDLLSRKMAEAQVRLGDNIHLPLSPAQVARDLHLSYSYFRRIFEAQTGFAPQHYRLEMRLRKACEFLRHTDWPLKDIAARLGYVSPFHFSADFKKRMGIAPSRWRLANG